MADEQERYKEGESAQRLDRLLGAVDFSAQLAVEVRKHRSESRELLLSFVEVLDSLRRLFGAWEKQKEEDWQANDRPTIRLIAQQLELALQRAGVESIACLGQSPEAGRHQVAAVRDDPGAEGVIIVEEIQRGYEWNGEILRKPVVVVLRRQGEAISNE